MHRTRLSLLAILLLTALAGALCISTYSTFGHIWDEPEHLAAGIALLDHGDYPYDDQHPPLARLAAAIGPYLAGARSHGTPPPNGEPEGRLILYHSTASYDKLLTLGRLGMLPFLAVLLLSTWAWVRRWHGDGLALLSVALLISTPAILGHAGVVALDVPVSGLIMLSLYWVMRWCEAPAWRHGLWLGLSAGLAVSTKMSAVPFIGVAALGLLATQAWFLHQQRRPWHWRARVQSGAAALALALGTLIASYGTHLKVLTDGAHHFNKALNLIGGAEGWWHDHVYAVAARTPLPLGVEKAALSVLGVEWHNRVGHKAFLLGHTSLHGWWYFYPVALAVKTPLPLLALGLSGLCLLAWRGWREQQLALCAAPVAFLTILVFSCAYSNINIGVRHVLVLYPLLALGAAWALVALWRRWPRPWPRMALAGLLLWQLSTVVTAYPDYLAYFNLTAGAHPERILVDSDLDWGQDLRRLGLELRRRQIPSIAIAYLGTADLALEGLPPFRVLPPGQPVHGWVAIDMLSLQESGEGYAWLSRYHPVMRVGKSIDLYSIP